MSCADRNSSIVDLLTGLVQTPSRAGIDPYDTVLERVAAWLSDHGVPHQFLTSSVGTRIAIWGRVEGAHPGPCYLLNATVDTAPFGDESRWAFPPTSAAQESGWLYGRGSGDSKAGVAIFCHALAALCKESGHWRGGLAFVFDADEHTGAFGGIKTFMAGHGNAMTLAGAMIGYPGNERIASGGRGFLRARLSVHGQSAHTGSSRRHGVNAVSRAAQLVAAVEAVTFPLVEGAAFPLPPRISVTAISGGSGFSVVPDLCSANVDVRLTPGFDREAARALVSKLVGDHDRAYAESRPTLIEWLDGWPAYQLSPREPVLAALRDSARAVLGRELPGEVVGPSSVANYLAACGVAATNGFGVTCENIHATDERIALDTLEPVFQTYCRALRQLLAS